MVYYLLCQQVHLGDCQHLSKVFGASQVLGTSGEGTESVLTQLDFSYPLQTNLFLFHSDSSWCFGFFLQFHFLYLTRYTQRTKDISRPSLLQFT